MKKLLLYTFVALAMQQDLYTQNFDPLWAERFQTVLDSAVQANNLKGAAAAVYFPGQGLWNSTTGIASPGVPLSPDKMLGIGSNTKTFIAVALLKLQEQGVLTLDDSLYHWLPSFQYVDSTITLRQLLTHQSGIFDYLNDGYLWNTLWNDTSEFWSMEELLATIGPPYFSPGHGSRYSNTNYLLTAMVIESATNKTWVQKLHDIIFDPLNLDSTFVAIHEPQNGAISPAFYNNQWYYHLITSVHSAGGAAGGIFSTAQEMTQWYKALFNHEIINEASLQEMLEIEPLSLAGMGIFVSMDEHLYYPRYQHTGQLVGYFSQILYDEKTESVCCFITNGLSNIFDPAGIIESLMKVLHYNYPKAQYDAGITRIISPWGNICTPSVTPIIELINYGIDPLTSVNIHIEVDGMASSIFPWDGSLNTDSSINVNLNDITADEGYHIFTCYTSLPNGGTDNYMFNDSITGNFIINSPNFVIAPFFEGFEDAVFPPSGWIKSPLAVTQWGRTSLTSFTGQSTAVKCNYWDENAGAKYNLDLPIIDISNINYPELDFMYAYTYYPNTPYDTLKILISSDCGNTWSTLFYEGGVALATAPPTGWDFNPKSSQWENKTISLSAFTGSVLIRFQNICGYGNNLFLDEIYVQGGVGISASLEDDTGIRIYPNPSRDIISVSASAIKGNTQLSIFTISGGKVMERQLTNTETQIDISALPRGTYFVRVMGEKNVSVGKFIKQ